MHQIIWIFIQQSFLCQALIHEFIYTKVENNASRGEICQEFAARSRIEAIKLCAGSTNYTIIRREENGTFLKCERAERNDSNGEGEYESIERWLKKEKDGFSVNFEESSLSSTVPLPPSSMVSTTPSIRSTTEKTPKDFEGNFDIISRKTGGIKINNNCQMDRALRGTELLSF